MISTQIQRALPGPTGTSCLTCKQRHKKCDMRRPVCARCEKGGYDCLGYSHNKRGVAPLPSIPKPRPVRGPQNKAGVRPTARSTYYPTSSDTGSPDSTSGVSPPSLRYEDTSLSASSSSPSGSSSRSLDVSPELSVDDALVNTIPACDDIIYVGSKATTSHGYRSLFATGHAPTKHSPLSPQFIRSLFSAYARLPDTPSYLSKAILGAANIDEYVMSHCDRVMEHAYFKPLSKQMAEMQCIMTKRLQASELTRWVMFLCARICESFVKSDTSQNKTYSLWIDQLQQALMASLTGTLDSSEIQDRRADWLETLLLKTMVEHGSSTYQLLRKATPTFLQMAYSEPTLWSSDCDPTCIPLVNAVSSRHEFAYFTLMDTTAAMAFGLPQQVEYDTSMKHLPTSSTAHEWVHSTPLEFQIALAEINACRDKSPSARCWEEIEFKLTTWQARLTEVDENWESWMTIAWFAVQESWRHALLIYLYMSVCGAFSDDPRVQASVRQILQVISTVRKRESSDVNVPFFIQYLMAGICARSEKQRSIARAHLANVSDTKFWLMRASDFVPVLDDLWHGAAADGRPIRWSDYVRSREKALPVVISACSLSKRRRLLSRIGAGSYWNTYSNKDLDQLTDGSVLYSPPGYDIGTHATGSAGPNRDELLDLHKKCDMRRPVCARCEKGGFDCLGYDHNKRGVAPLPTIPKPRPIRGPQTKTGVRPAARPTYHPTSSDTESPDSTSAVSPPRLRYKDTSQSASSSSESSNASPEVNVGETLVKTTSTGGDIIYLDSKSTASYGYRSLFAAGSPPAKRSHLSLPSLQALFSTYARLPDTPSYLSKAILGTADVEEYVATHCDRMMKYAYFKPLGRHMSEMQCVITKRLQTSELTRWIMFLCARVCESAVKSDSTHNKTYSLWIDHLQQALRASLTGTLDSSEVQDRRADWLEMLLLKTMVEHSSNTYQLLRSATPTFLQMVYSEPTLWSGDCDLTCVPLVNMINSARHEFAFFALMDTTAAMAFGLPQQVEYDTSMKHLPTSFTAHEWVHSTPLEFQIALAEINACRDKSPNARCWEEIEFKLTTWKARLTEVDKNWESWMTIAWFAVQESWRHTLLIYLYLSVCGAFSDDPRVQASVRQILQVISTVRKRGSSDVNVPFFIQYLMASQSAGFHASYAEHVYSGRDMCTQRETAVDSAGAPSKCIRHEVLADAGGRFCASAGRLVAWHKKCDSRRPVCQRCEKGGLECLGYSHNGLPPGPLKRLSIRPRQVPGSRQVVSNYIPEATIQPTPSAALLVQSRGTHGEPPVGALPESSPASPILHFDGRVTNSIQSQDRENRQLIDPRLSTVPDHGFLLISRFFDNAPTDPTQLLQTLVQAYSGIPYLPHRLSNPLLGSSVLEDLIVAHYEHMIQWSYFRPPRSQITPLRRMFVTRTRASKFGSWIMLIGTHICESLAKGDSSRNGTYSLWIKQVEQVAREALDRYFTPEESQNRLGNWLDISFLKGLLVQSSHTPRVLRESAKEFLQMAFSEPALWPSHSDPTSVPLINVATSAQAGFSYFALIDITSAMILGIPQQVEYDTSLGRPSSGSITHGRMHGIPLEFQITIAEINACRDKSPYAPSWKDIERRLITWQPRPNEYDPSWESHVIIAWFAVEESWRHTLLVYLYLTVCGASSDDPRIESSARQIFQVVETVKQPGTPGEIIPFFPQYLIAGICARSEKHRSLVQRHLSTPSGSRFWLVRAVDFMPVLEDLWCGAAVEGRPIGWTDYMRSREKVLPVTV